MAAFCAAFVAAFSLALRAANGPRGIKAAAAVSADPFIATFKNSLREVIVNLPLFLKKLYARAARGCYYAFGRFAGATSALVQPLSFGR